MHMFLHIYVFIWDAHITGGNLPQQLKHSKKKNVLRVSVQSSTGKWPGKPGPLHGWSACPLHAWSAGKARPAWPALCRLA